MGVARIIKESYQDPTTQDDRWVVVEIEPVVECAQPVTLADIRIEPALADISLVKRGRISVVPVERLEFQKILRMAKTVLPAAGAAKKRPRKTPGGRADA